MFALTTLKLLSRNSVKNLFYCLFCLFSRDNSPAHPLFILQQTYQWRMIMLGRCSLLSTDNIIIFTTNNQLSDYYLFFTARRYCKVQNSARWFIRVSHFV